MNRYTAIFTPDKEDGGWVAQCAEVPSAIAQGETKREARDNLKAAVQFMLRVEAKAALKKAPKGASVEPIKVPA